MALSSNWQINLKGITASCWLDTFNMKRISEIALGDVSVKLFDAEASVFPVMPISRLLASVLKPSNAEHVLDVGTGSGIFAIVAALRGARAVTAVDTNLNALDAARKNAELNQVDQKVQFIMSDLFSALDEDSFDVIVGNPPCMPVPPEYETKNFNLRLAVDGGCDGTLISLRFLQEARRYLRSGGRLYFPVAKWCNFKKILSVLNADYNWGVIAKEDVRFWLVDFGVSFRKHVLDLQNDGKCDLIMKYNEPYAEVLICELQKNNR